MVERRLLPKYLVRFMKQKKNFEGPSLIQAYCWVALTGENCRDVVGIAKTGSGKSLAFLLPVFVKVRDNKNQRLYDVQNDGPQLLVLPRELCQQIFSESTEFGQPRGNSNSLCLRR